MNEIPSQTSPELKARLGEVQRFGRASESLFRRFYARASRRQLEEDLRQHQSELRRQRTEQDALRRTYAQLQGEQRGWRRELARLQAVLGSLDDGIIVQDLNGKVTMMNGAAEEMLGGKRAFWDSALGTLFNRYRDVRETAGDLTPLGETGALPLNNRIVQAQLIAIGGDDNRRIGTVIILRDITHDALALRLKEGFVSHIAREMEKPIGVIKLASELLGAEPEDAAINQRLLDKLLNNVDTLDQLALELSDITKIEAGEFDVAREPVSLERVIWTVAKGMAADMRSRGIDLIVMARGLRDLQVLGDDTRLQWALGHLIRNGVENNRERGHVTLAARVEARGGKEYALISVSDNGVGISPGDLPRVFERFYRVRQDPAGRGARGRPGLGQGLYVAEAICRAHGGFLQAQSRERVGSVFTMGLPVHRERSAVA